jgi:translocator protein
MFRSLLLSAPALCILTTGAITSTFCTPLTDSGENVPFRPPGWVFSVVWPILYVCLGVSWYLGGHDTEHAILLASLCLWLPVYQCRKEKFCASLILLLSVSLSIFLSHRMFLEQKTLSASCLVPLCVWLLFAYTINVYDVIERLNRKVEKKITGGENVDP